MTIAAVAGAGSVERAVAGLVAATDAEGSPDNIGIALVQIGSSSGATTRRLAGLRAAAAWRDATTSAVTRNVAAGRSGAAVARGGIRPWFVVVAAVVALAGGFGLWKLLGGSGGDDRQTSIAAALPAGALSQSAPTPSPTASPAPTPAPQPCVGTQSPPSLGLVGHCVAAGETPSAILLACKDDALADDTYYQFVRQGDADLFRHPDQLRPGVVWLPADHTRTECGGSWSPTPPPTPVPTPTPLPTAAPVNQSKGHTPTPTPRVTLAPARAVPLQGAGAEPAVVITPSPTRGASPVIGAALPTATPVSAPPTAPPPAASPPAPATPRTPRPTATPDPDAPPVAVVDPPLPTVPAPTAAPPVTPAAPEPRAVLETPAPAPTATPTPAPPAPAPIPAPPTQPPASTPAPPPPAPALTVAPTAPPSSINPASGGEVARPGESTPAGAVAPAPNSPGSGGETPGPTVGFLVRIALHLKGRRR